MKGNAGNTIDIDGEVHRFLRCQIALSGLFVKWTGIRTQKWHFCNANLIVSLTAYLRTSNPQGRKDTMKNLIIVILAIVISGSILLPTPAQAAVTDPGIYNMLKNRRASLADRENNLLRSRDTLLRIQDDLNRHNDNNQNNTRLDQLKKELYVNDLDLQKVRLDLRDVDRALV